MGILSLLLAFAAGILCLLGLLTAVIPVVGTVLAFSAPLAALAGVCLGGVSWSRARRERRAVELPVVAVMLNVMAFVPALTVALTCGVCNAMLSSGPIKVQRFGSWSVGAGVDGGLPLFPTSQAPLGSARVGSGAGAAPDGGLATEATIPPPSLPAGPRTPPPVAPPAE
ncbi:MAG: hypothetical protein OXU20_01020 [Myxococcales bacterium]|nr:hypothetical protein [Myxococcales bacterium]MDD9969759.1 hypothetical protein [Myxococcales bacterium]